MNAHILHIALLLSPVMALADGTGFAKESKTETLSRVETAADSVSSSSTKRVTTSTDSVSALSAKRLPAVTDTIPPTSVELEDLEVVATRPLIKSDGAKLSYSMKEDISSKGLTLSDALRKVPMVTVDGEGNIRINGQENFKIYLNGKEDPALSANYKDLFKAMPADAVLKVEVITEPGAKYDAEGTAGILNLVTISKNSTDGYSASISGRFTKQQSGISIYGRMKTGKLSMSANINYTDGRIFPQTNWNEQHIENLNSDNLRYQVNKLQQKVGWNYIGGGLNLSYDLTDKDLITFNTNINYMNGSLMKGGYSYFEGFDPDHKFIGSSMRSLEGGLTEESFNASLAWQHSFGENGTKMILSYLYNRGLNHLEATLTEDEAQGAQLVSPYEHTSNKTISNEHTIQLDFITPLADENHSLDAGGKAIFRRNPAKSFTLWQPDENIADNLSDILQKQDIYAVYVAYTGRFDKISTTAGVRYEHTGMGIDFRTGEETDFFNHLNDVVPNAALVYSFTEASSLRLSYQMRISRPSLRQVNPYELIVIPDVVEKGNPNLDSERANKLTLTYSNYGRTIGGNAGVDFSYVANAISQFSYSKDEVSYYSYANIGYKRSFAFFGYMNWSPLNFLQLSVNARLTRQILSAGSEGLRNSSWKFNYGANVDCRLPAKLRLNIHGGQSTREYSLQGCNDGWYYYGLGLSRGFLKKNALTLTLTANQFLQKEMKVKSYVATENMINKFAFHNKNWNVGISLTWNLGSLKSDVKKAARKIENDDQSAVAGQSSI